MVLWKKAAILLLIMPVLTPGRASAQDSPGSALSLDSSDERLEQCFEWAKTQAMSYAHRGDAVGSWYEAALPNREAFCMRDASHQAMGAHVLGLQEHTRNMLRKFAVNISDSKDWCSFWEINRYDKPAPVDYRNDEEFWYNLPANFDVLNACYRMYLWSHDRAYLDDPVFVEFYRRTVTDYVARWDLTLDRVLRRERFMNAGGQRREGVVHPSRGIPSYDEGRPGRTRLGVDLLAFQAAAYRAYARLSHLRGNTEDSEVFAGRSAAVCRLMEDHFWDQANGRFNELLLTDGRYAIGGDMRVYLLYNDAVTAPDRIGSTLQSLVSGRPINIEIGSHYPEIFYRYGAHEQAYHRLLELGHPQTPRREYPEVSFALISAMAGGLMGIEPCEEAGRVATLSRLVEPLSWVELGRVPIHGNVIDVRHDGRTQTVLSNRSGQAIVWIARFYGTGRIEADGKALDTKAGKDAVGEPLIWAEVPVVAGSSRTARRIAP